MGGEDKTLGQDRMGEVSEGSRISSGFSVNVETWWDEEVDGGGGTVSGEDVGDGSGDVQITSDECDWVEVEWFDGEQLRSEVGLGHGTSLSASQRSL